MALYKTLLVLGLATAGPFSFAQQIVERGNAISPYQPPFWIVRMAKPERSPSIELDSFIVGFREVTPSPGRIQASGIKYPCLRYDEVPKVKTWQFCDM